MYLHRIRQIDGFTLVEVLVSILVLSISLLGLASLQSTALRFNHSAYQKSQVVEFINDMADRMRANRGGVNSGNYASITATPGQPDFDCMTDFTNTTETGVCSAQEMAVYDAYAWRTALAQILPVGAGSVICTDDQDATYNDVDGDGINDADSDGGCTLGSTHLIMVSWDDDRDGAADLNFQVTFLP